MRSTRPVQSSADLGLANCGQPVCLDDVVTTAQLRQRPTRTADYEAESKALVGLAQELAESPETFLQRLVETAMSLCKADSAGISVLENTSNGDVFRWQAVAGAFAPLINGTLPRSFSPCGAVLDRNATQLMEDPARFYPYITDIKPTITEVLLVPFYKDSTAIGTIWVVSHSPSKRFQSEDERLITSLTQFASAAMQTLTNLKATEHALESLRQESADRKQAESAGQKLADMVEHQARVYDAILSTTPDFAYLFDRDGRFVYANNRLLEVWGRKLEDVIGKTCLELGYEQWHHDMHMREIAQILVTKKPIRSEVPFTAVLTGISGVYDYILTPVFGDNGEVEYVAGITRDITAARQAERERLDLYLALQAERANLAAVIDKAPAFICVLHGPDHIFELANEHYLHLIGRDEQDIIGKSLRDVVPELQGQGYFELLDRVFQTGDSYEGTESAVLLRRKGGTELEERVLSFVYQAINDGAGKISAIFVHGVDVTDSVRARKSLHELAVSERAARSEAESANLAKDKFIAVLSHELRTPLSPVALTIPVMEADKDMPPQFREDLAMIRRNIDLEVKLIDDLLDISRVISGKLHLERRTVFVHEILSHAIRNSLGDSVSKRLVFRQDFKATNDRVFADPARLQQVFWNLLRNAVKFTPEGGEIIVSTWNDEAGDRLFLDVRDNGQGIEAAALDRIFDPFEQGGTRATNAFGGLGLGLAIAKAITEMHGGTISATSGGVGKGSTFSIALRTATGVMSSENHPETNGDGIGAAGPPPRVLLVEDHLDTARVMTRLLSMAGFYVKAAGTAAAALEAANVEPFDIVVSDIGLPDATGYELMEQLRERFGLKGIALSGYGMEEDIRRSQSAGFVEHIVKPVGASQLQSIILKVAREHLTTK